MLNWSKDINSRIAHSSAYKLRIMLGIFILKYSSTKDGVVLVIDYEIALETKIRFIIIKINVVVYINRRSKLKQYSVYKLY